MIDGLLAATLEGIVDTFLAETVNSFEDDTGAAAIAIISVFLPAVGGIASTIIAATAELAAIGAASSATYHTATSGIVTFPVRRSSDRYNIPHLQENFQVVQCVGLTEEHVTLG
jgi:hypothetical protein